MPYLVVYDKDTHRTVSGLVGITFGGGKRARQERTVRHGNERPGRRGREPDYRCARRSQVIPGMQAELFGQREENGYANPVIVTLDLMP